MGERELGGKILEGVMVNNIAREEEKTPWGKNVIIKNGGTRE